jgi:hypothetical protein
MIMVRVEEELGLAREEGSLKEGVVLFKKSFIFTKSAWLIASEVSAVTISSCPCLCSRCSWRLSLSCLRLLFGVL